MFGEVVSGGSSLFIRNCDNPIDHASIQHFRNEAGANALNFMYAVSAARQDGRVRWFHHKKSHILNLRFEDLSGTGGSPSRTDSNNECIKFAANNMEDFLGGGLAVDLWIGW